MCVDLKTFLRYIRNESVTSLGEKVYQIKAEVKNGMVLIGVSQSLSRINEVHVQFVDFGLF